MRIFAREVYSGTTKFKSANVSPAPQWVILHILFLGDEAPPLGRPLLCAVTD